MGLAERKEREKAEMRKRILDAAYDQFLEFGYEKTSIRNIADIINYSPGTIYLYFKDKNTIFLELHTRAFDLLVESIISTPYENISEFENLAEMGRRFLNFGIQNPELYSLLYLITAPMDSLTDSHQFWKNQLNGIEMVKYFIERCKTENYFHTMEITPLAAMMVSTVNGLVIMYLSDRTKYFDSKNVMKDDIELIFAGYENFVNIGRRSQNKIDDNGRGF